jgi:hypothetical protein
VDQLVEQIGIRNHKDRHDRVDDADRLLPPAKAETYRLPEVPSLLEGPDIPMYILDTSDELTKEAMSLPVAKFVAEVLVHDTNLSS